MTDQQPEQDDTDSITVGLTLHNPTGEGDTTLLSPVLGLEPFILIQAGDGGPELTAGHLSADDVAGGLALTLQALLQSSEMTDEGRESVSELLALVEDAL